MCMKKYFTEFPVPTIWALKPKLKIDFRDVNEELFQWVPTILTLEPTMKLDYLHVSEELFQLAPTIWSQLLRWISFIWMKNDFNQFLQTPHLKQIIRWASFMWPVLKMNS